MGVIKTATVETIIHARFGDSEIFIEDAFSKKVESLEEALQQAFQNKDIYGFRIEEQQYATIDGVRFEHLNNYRDELEAINSRHSGPKYYIGTLYTPGEAAAEIATLVEKMEMNSIRSRLETISQRLRTDGIGFGVKFRNGKWAIARPDAGDKVYSPDDCSLMPYST